MTKTVNRESLSVNRKGADGMSGFDRFLSYFFLAVLCLFLGQLWAYLAHIKDNKGIDPRQIETQIRHELQEGPGVPFRIAGTNMEITPWRDGSGVLRIKERP